MASQGNLFYACAGYEQSLTVFVGVSSSLVYSGPRIGQGYRPGRRGTLPIMQSARCSVDTLRPVLCFL